MTLHHDRVDRYLVAATLVVALATAWLLFSDRYLFVAEPERAAPLEKLATLVGSSNIVRKRSHDLPVWDAAVISQDLHLKDLLFTDAASTAQLTFDDGTLIELGENTLVVLERQEERAVLNVVRGTLRAEAKPGVEPRVAVRTGRRGVVVIPSAAARLEVTVQASGIADVAIAAGSARVGEVAVRHAERTTVAPAAVGGSPLVAAPTPLAATEAPAEVADGMGETGDAITPLHDAVPPGPSAPESPAVESPPLRAPELAPRYEILLPQLRSAPSPATRLLRWLQGLVESTAFAEERQPALPGTVEWPAVTGASGYRVEVARDRSFERPILQRDTIEPRVDLSNLAPGEYIVRVAAFDAAGRLGVASEAIVTIARRPRLAPPPMLHPGADESLRLETHLPVVTFRWGGVPGAAAYHVQISRDDRFGTILLDKKTRGSELGFELADGAYHWRIRSLAGPDDSSPGGWSWSTPRRFSVRHVMSPQVRARVERILAHDAAPAVSPGSDPAAAVAAVAGDQVGAAAVAPHRPAVRREGRDSDDRPRDTIRLALAPQYFSYRGGRGDESEKIDATLFNSWSGHGVVWLGSSRKAAVEGSFARTATVLFRDGPRTGREQSELMLKPFNAQGSLRFRLVTGQGGGYLDLRGGYAVDGVAHLRRRDDLTLGLTHVLFHGPAVGGELGGRVGPLRLAVESSWSHAVGSAPPRGSAFQSFLGGARLAYPVGNGHWALLLGAFHRRQTYSTGRPDGDELASPVKVQASSLQLGFEMER